MTSFVAKLNPDDYGPPLPPWLRVYLGLNYVFKEDVDLVHVVVGTSSVGLPNFKKAKRAAIVSFIYVHKLSIRKYVLYYLFFLHSPIFRIFFYILLYCCCHVFYFILSVSRLTLLSSRSI